MIITDLKSISLKELIVGVRKGEKQLLHHKNQLFRFRFSAANRDDFRVVNVVENIFDTPPEDDPTTGGG